MNTDLVRIGLVSISDRASTGAYEDRGLPALKQWFDSVLANPWNRRAPDSRRAGR
jgi:molybdopterin adenylyltransferase